jgi:hypothetical protein
MSSAQPAADSWNSVVIATPLVGWIPTYPPRGGPLTFTSACANDDAPSPPVAVNVNMYVPLGRVSRRDSTGSETVAVRRTESNSVGDRLLELHKSAMLEELPAAMEAFKVNLVLGFTLAGKGWKMIWGGSPGRTSIVTDAEADR